MLPFPAIEAIRQEFGEEKVTEQVYADAKRDYEAKLVSETALFDQFQRRGLTEEEATKLFCEFLIREAVFLALHDAVTQ